MSDATETFYEEMPNGDTVSSPISRARSACGLSVKDIAWRLDVKMATVDAWEHDNSAPIRAPADKSGRKTSRRQPVIEFYTASA